MGSGNSRCKVPGAEGGQQSEAPCRKCGWSRVGVLELHRDQGGVSEGGDPGLGHCEDLDSSSVWEGDGGH